MAYTGLSPSWQQRLVEAQLLGNTNAILNKAGQSTGNAVQQQSPNSQESRELDMQGKRNAALRDQANTADAVSPYLAKTGYEGANPYLSLTGAGRRRLSERLREDAEDVQETLRERRGRELPARR